MRGTWTANGRRRGVVARAAVRGAGAAAFTAATVAALGCYACRAPVAQGTASSGGERAHSRASLVTVAAFGLAGRRVAYATSERPRLGVWSVAPLKRVCSL